MLIHISVASRREPARVVGMGATVGSYHGVLTAASGHGMQERQARLVADLAPTKSVPLRSERQKPSLHLHRWEDDGGSVRKREQPKKTT